MIDVPVFLDNFRGVALNEHGNSHSGKLLLDNLRHGKGENDISDAIGTDDENVLNVSIQIAGLL
jgi:hypothetical protein